MGSRKLFLNYSVSKLAINFTKFRFPHSRINQSFIDVFIYMKQTYQSIVVGMQKGKEGKVIANPDTNELLEQGDYLIIIATENPQQQVKLQSQSSEI